MTVTIERIRPEDIEGFHRAVDLVARERKYLAFLEGPPLEMSRASVLPGGLGVSTRRCRATYD